MLTHLVSSPQFGIHKTNKNKNGSPIWYPRLNEAVNLQSQVDSRVAITLVRLSNHLAEKYRFIWLIGEQNRPGR